ncbi:MFS transporter [Cryobacterium frigoriphilum]|uniref:MFS transporter n=1 Tax=Cryobacterium frigoriphilum TaxID=1259150 RepID=A0A4R9A9A3_9MICO|nr:MFS transporter [Cryobacterium frigoriphilum]TFD54491.1 MFS transporter [Cryobacterium frigoriphilum]
MLDIVPTADRAVNQEAPAGRATRFTGRQRLALFVLLTASFTLAVDFSILNVALPTIGSDLGFALDHLQWIASSFALCAAGFTLFFGRLADLFGRRRLFLLGMALLGVSSLVGGFAHEPVVMIVSRVAQGLATAMVVPAALSLLTTSFAEGPQRNTVLGLNGALMAAGFTTGAILGGVLTDLLSWRWAFFINIFVAVVVLVIAPFVLSESRPHERPKLDLAGAVTVTLGLLALVYGLTTAGETSWDNPLAWGALLVGVVFLVVFWQIEKRVAHPLVPVAILKRKTVAWGNVAGLLAFATETSLVFLLTLYLQKVLGYSPLAAGLSFAVLGAGTVLGAIIGPKVIGTLGSRRAIVAGFLLQAAATFPLLFLGPDSGWILLLLVATFIGGVANLVAIVGYVVTSTSGLPDNEQGLATGLVTMSQQIGITMGIPIMSAIVTARMNALGETGAASVLDGVTTAVGVNAVLCVLAAAAIALFLRHSTSDQLNA